MRKIHAAFFAGAVVIALGTATGFAVLRQSHTDNTSGHIPQLTARLSDGNAETIRFIYDAANLTVWMAPMNTDWAQPFVHHWTVPSFVGFDSIFDDIDRDVRTLTGMPMNIPIVPDLSTPMLNDWPGGSSISVISETVSNGTCLRYTQVTKSEDDIQPRIVSQTSGNCGSVPQGSEISPPTPAMKVINFRTPSGHAATRI